MKRAREANEHEQAGGAHDVVDVVVRWAGTVVAVERLAAGEAFTVGPAAARARHFVWQHEALEEPACAVVEVEAGGVRLRAPPGGVLRVDGADVAARELVVDAAHAARVVLGAIEIAAQPAQRTKAAPAARELDARFLRISGSALVVHAGLVCALLLARELPRLDAALPQGVRTVAEAWAARPPAPARAPARPAPQEVAPLSLPTAVAGVQVPRAEHKKPRADDRALALEALASLGLVGSQASSAFGDDGPIVPAALGGLSGRSGGAGGDGMGVRRGAGGVSGASIGVGGLGPLGDGPDDAPTVGLPAKERTPVRIAVFDRFDHEHGLSRDEIQRVMARATAQVRACYERELGGAPDLEGKVVLAFTIAASGDVAASQVAQRTLAGEEGARVGGCIERAVRRLKFPQPRGGGVVQVTYPYVLARSGG